MKTILFAALVLLAASAFAQTTSTDTEEVAKPTTETPAPGSEKPAQ